MHIHFCILLYIFFADVECAQAALELLNGYRMLDKPLIIEFGRKKSEETDAKTDGSSVDTSLVQNNTQSCNEKTL